MLDSLVAVYQGDVMGEIPTELGDAWVDGGWELDGSAIREQFELLSAAAGRHGDAGTVATCRRALQLDDAVAARICLEQLLATREASRS